MDRFFFILFAYHEMSHHLHQPLPHYKNLTFTVIKRIILIRIIHNFTEVYRQRKETL